MLLSRRSFIGALSCLPFVKKVVPSEFIYKPLNSTTPVSLWGIPYHSNVDVIPGQWLGIPRKEAYPELQKLIKLIQDEKRNENLLRG